jgi:hypothetical protein
VNAERGTLAQVERSPRWNARPGGTLAQVERVHRWNACTGGTRAQVERSALPGNGLPAYAGAVSTCAAPGPDRSTRAGGTLASSAAAAQVFTRAAGVHQGRRCSPGQVNSRTGEHQPPPGNQAWRGPGGSFERSPRCSPAQVFTQILPCMPRTCCAGYVMPNRRGPWKNPGGWGRAGGAQRAAPLYTGARILA